jgi:hypothetical protein
MNRIGVYILLVVLGGAIGASGLYFFMASQSPVVTEPQVKVTIQGIAYVDTDYPVLEIELLNDAPERNLDGTVGIIQGDKQWTSEVTWYYTGYGEAAILVDTINLDESFRVTYNEKNPQAKYLDRTIEWNEVDKTITTSLNSGELTITSVEFTYVNAEKQTISVHVINSGTNAKTVRNIRVNGELSSSWSSVGSDTVAAGESEYFIITHEVISGNKYSIALYDLDGTLVGAYVSTASVIDMETKELSIAQMTFDTTNNQITVYVKNSGTSTVIVSLVKINGETQSAFSGTTTYEAGDTGIITIDYSSGVIAGNKYAISLFIIDGTLVGSYMDTA